MHEYWEAGKVIKVGGAGALLFAVIGGVIAYATGEKGDRAGRVGWGLLLGAFIGGLAGAPLAASLFG
jgi:hypothetical protein